MDAGSDRQTATPAEVAWQQQSVWSQAANHLKADLTRWRVVALGLTIAGAVLATLAVQVAELSSPAGKALALAGAVAVGLVPVIRGRFGSRVAQDWTRARSTSEALKSEVFMYLAGTGRYRDADRDQQLQDQVDAIQRDAGDLLLNTAGLQPVARGLPAVHDIDSDGEQLSCHSSHFLSGQVTEAPEGSPFHLIPVAFSEPRNLGKWPHNCGNHGVV